MKDKLSFSKFILCLIIPFAAVTNYRLNRRIVSVDLQKSRNTYNVKDILKEIFQEFYRLKTNDLSGELSSMTHSGYIKDFYWHLLQHLGSILLSESHSCHPLLSLSPYLVIKPYKPEMDILHWMEIFSIMGIFVSLLHNIFRVFLCVYDINGKDPVKFVWQGFVIFDLVFSPICVLIYFFIVTPIYN